MALDFGKEEIQAPKARVSSLTASLAQASSGEAQSSATTTVTATVAHSSAGSEVSQSSARKTFSVKQVIDAVKQAALNKGHIEQMHASARFALHVAEDDGTVDTDFPELDPGIAITQVGVSQFVLCRDSVHNPALLLNIPKSKVALHACETNVELPTLEVTCQPNAASPTHLGSVGAVGSKRATFAVHLQQEHTAGGTHPAATGSAASPQPTPSV